MSYPGQWNGQMNNSQLLPNNAVYFLPWITALIMGGLAVSTFVSWARSKDHLPGYLQGPALIGGVCCCIAVISSGVAGFLITKGENHWKKKKHRDFRRARAGHYDTHTHPMENVWPQRLVFATLMAAMWTEGSYLYMLLCILISAESDDRDYCFRFTNGAAKCEGDGIPWVWTLSFALGSAVALAAYFESTMHVSIANFHSTRRDLVQLANASNQQGNSGNSYDRSNGNFGDSYDGSNGNFKGQNGRYNDGYDDYS